MQRKSSTQSQLKAANAGHPNLSQESSYEGYERLAEPFTETDKYNYLDAFFMGLQMDDFYEYSDECVNAWVFMIDDFAYLKNNRTLVPQDSEENWFHVYLNITGLVAGSMSDILPECYQLYKSVVEREQDRWRRFDRSWGNFFLAFLFNQMGNALNFQQKFQNIRLNKETQNFQGVWLEWGDLIHIIYDFEPLEDAALEDINSYITEFVENQGWNTDPFTENLLTTGLAEVSNLILDNKALIDDKISGKWARDAKARGEDPEVGFATYEAWDSTADLAYGFANGLVDVFPIDSLPDQCRDNTTSIYDAVRFMFIDQVYNLPEQDVEFVLEIQNIMKFPYGASFSCYFSFASIFIAKWDPLADGELTEEEALKKSIILVTDVITNILFNLGYMYSDVLNFVILEDSALNYWQKIGYYCGDFAIRFFWRKEFLTTFEY